jgi:multiple sugar transport system permease protein
MPWLLLLGARDLLVSMHQTFAPAFLMTRGGPYYATLFLPQLIYQTAFDRLRLGEAALMLLLLLGGFGALIWLAARWFRHHLYTDDL